MDRAWATNQLRVFVSRIDQLERVERGFTSDAPGEMAQERQELEDEIQVLEPGMRMLMEAAQLGLGDYSSIHHTDPFENWPTRWRLAKNRALQAIGLLTLGVEAKARMRPDAPELSADQLHPWVWDAARSLWEGSSHQEAVQTAARSINARLQQKLSRRDVSEAALCREAFTTKDPEAGRPRLRFPGDRTSDTWRSRQQGALDFGAGCFEGIRNPATHEHRLDLPEQVALEQLAALSILARWVDECDVKWK